MRAAIWNKRLLLPGSAVVFILSLILYLVCLDTGASLWDCPEYILCAYRLEVEHPPGNPTWQLMANVASHFAAGPSDVALAVNLTSALATALAAMLLYQIIYCLLRYSLFRRPTQRHEVMAAAASFSGTLCFAWCDSVIFSAVEAEVYALSLFFTALMIRLMLMWAVSYMKRQKERARRLLILTAYISGLSFGVHELNLLAFTAMALIYLFVKTPRKTPGKFWLAIGVSFLLIWFSLMVYFPGLVKFTAILEISAVNGWGWAYGNGALTAIALIFIVLGALPFCFKNKAIVTAAWSLFFFTVGCSTYILIPLRANANPPINTGDPSDPMAFMAYFKREQYGSKPLFYGPTPYSEPEKIDTESGKKEYIRQPGTPRYEKIESGAVVNDRFGMLTPEDSASNARVMKSGHGYLKTGYNFNYQFTPELNMFFPRFGRNPDRIPDYAAWTGMTPETMERVITKDGDVKRRPTYWQQFKFMVGYQIGYMYLRYIMWNFSGRQNNYPTTGEPEHGNFITGLAWADNAMLGDQNRQPATLWEENRGHNVYYMLPLIVGLAGAIGFGCGRLRQRRVSEVVLWLFLMTGVAIIFYLNQDLGEPRERDYAFLGSIMAFCIWIGMGVAWIANLFKGRTAPLIAITVLALGLPALILSRTYDDHNRHGRATADSVGVNILNSLEADAIIFVDGDNITFPLWYAQEVLGERPDVTVVNTSYLSTDWYRRQHSFPGTVAEIVKANDSLPNPRPVYWHRTMADRKYDGYKSRTVHALLTRKLFDGDSLAAARNADMEGYRAMSRMKPGGRFGPQFITEPYVTNSISSQRVSALLLARRLMNRGEAERAREVAGKALELWPFEVVPARSLVVDGDTINELLESRALLAY